MLTVTKKQKEKLKIEVLHLSKIINISYSFRDEFTKQKH